MFNYSISMSSSSSSSVPQLEIRDKYTDVSFVVFGYGGGKQTQSFMHLLKNPSGRSNFGNFTYSTDANGEPVKKPGYVYSAKRDRVRVGKLVEEINAGKHAPVSYEPQKNKVATSQPGSSNQPLVSAEPDLKNYVSKELFMQIVSRVQVLEQEVALLRAATLGKPNASGKDEVQEEDIQDESEDEEAVVEPTKRRCPLWGPNRKNNAK
jgi:hypothetical protein